MLQPAAERPVALARAAGDLVRGQRHDVGDHRPGVVADMDDVVPVAGVPPSGSRSWRSVASAGRRVAVAGKSGVAKFGLRDGVPGRAASNSRTASWSGVSALLRPGPVATAASGRMTQSPSLNLRRCRRLPCSRARGPTEAEDSRAARQARIRPERLPEVAIGGPHAVSHASARRHSARGGCRAPGRIRSTSARWRPAAPRRRNCPSTAASAPTAWSRRGRVAGDVHHAEQVRQLEAVERAEQRRTCAVRHPR